MSRILSSVLLAFVLVGTAAIPRNAHAQDDSGAARAAFDRGVRRFDQRRYEQALAAFREAYAIRSHPAVIFNIASCLDKLGRAVDAVNEYQRYLRLRGAEIEGSRRADVEGAMARLRRRVALLTIQLPTDDAAVQIDATPIELSEDPVAVSPGAHTISSASRDGRSVSQEVTAVAGESQDVVLRFEVSTPAQGGAPGQGTPAGEPEHPSDGVIGDRYDSGPRGWNRSLRWVGIGATVLFAGAWVYTGLRALSLNSDYEQSPSQDLRDEGLTYRALADFVFLPCTVLAAGFTVLSFVLARPDVRSTGERALVAPVLWPGGGAIVGRLGF